MKAFFWLIPLFFFSHLSLAEWNDEEKQEMISGCVKDHFEMGANRYAAERACSCMADESEKRMTIRESYELARMVQQGNEEAIQYVIRIASPCYELLR